MGGVAKELSSYSNFGIHQVKSPRPGGGSVEERAERNKHSPFKALTGGTAGVREMLSLSRWSSDLRYIFRQAAKSMTWISRLQVRQQDDRHFS